MAASNRQALITKVQKVLKNHYEPVTPPADRTVLEHLLYACCLENAPYEAADEAFAKLQQSFFDWNEVRVTTVAELAETMSCLPAPAAAATRLKRCLQNVFEAHYAFDIEPLKKQNLGKSVKDLQSINGITPFVVNYVSQHGLGGHAIPCSQGVFDVFEILDIITSAEAAKGRVPGLERAIPKAKGIDFASLLHQLGADFFISPFSTKVRDILMEISPDAKDRLPKRSTKPSESSNKTAESPTETEAEGKKPTTASGKKTAASTKKSATKKPPAKKSPEKKAGAKKPAKKKSTTSKKAPSKKSATKQLTRKKPR